MKFAEIRQGDVLLTLEQDRRSQFPIFDFAKVQKLSQPTMQRVGKDGHYAQVVGMTIVDGTGTYEIFVPLDAEDCIYDKIYYTPNPKLIADEIKVQQSRARQVLDNVDRYKAIDNECTKILQRLTEATGGTAQPARAAEYSELEKKVDEQGAMLARIYNSIFAENEQEKPTNKKKQ